MRWIVWLAAAPAAAHMVSMSTGEAVVDGARLHYVMRVPEYEVSHLKNPERDLLPQITFEGAKRLSGSCRPAPAESAYICEAGFEYGAQPDTIRVRSTLHRVTVPNHVHLLRATRGDVTDQAVLELTFPEAELRFRPPTPYEVAFQQIAAGVTRAAAGPAQILFLLALVIAARSRRELMALAGGFIAGQVAASAAACAWNWLPVPRFLEAAAALTIAYLAVEILFLPDARHRWAVVGVLGAFHGLAVESFLSATGYQAHWVFTGVLAADLALIAALGWIWSRIGGPGVARALAGVLLAIGLGWFGWRLQF